MRFSPLLLGAVAAVGFASVASAQIAFDASALRDIEDFDVYLADGVEVGDIEEVLVDSTGAIVAVTVDLEDRFGDRDVAFPIDQLVFQNDRYVTELTQADIEALPTFDD